MSQADKGPTGLNYKTAGGIRVRREDVSQAYAHAADPIAGALDSRRGVLLTS